LCGLIICLDICVNFTDFASADPILSPKFSEVIENSSLELTCYASKNTTIIKWCTLHNNKIIDLVLTSKEGECTKEGFMAKDKTLEISCCSNGIFKLNIKSVDIINHGQAWICNDEFNWSNFAYINIKGKI
jgi:hypothetical protein